MKSKITKITKITSTSKRYDIQTSTNNFYANKILVHNSIIKCFYHDCRWEISTRGTAYAESNVGVEDFTFRDLVLVALNMDEEEFQKFANVSFDSDFTYVFEILSPKNRIVTPYEEDELVLLGIVHNQSSKEMTYDFMSYFVSELYSPSIRIPKVYSATSTAELEELVASLTGLQEGVVCWNESTGERIKVKSAQYLVAHKLRGNNGQISKESICELVVTNDFSEFLCYFPEDKPKFDIIIDKYNWLVNDCALVYDTIKDIEIQKDFAMKAKDHKMSSIMFTARARKISTKQAISEAKTSFLVKVLMDVE